jgi:hypothetical protein
MIIDGNRIEIIKANENYAEKFYEYLQELKDDPENYTVIRYREVKLEDVKKIKWEDNPMFLALKGNRVVESLQIIRGKYFGVRASLNFHEFVSNSQPLGFTRVTGYCPTHPPPPL